MSVRTAPAGAAFLRLLDPDDPEKANEQYVVLRRQLRNFFKWRHCADPDELADDTLTRGFLSIERGVVIETTLAAYLRGIANHVFSEHQKTSARRPSVPFDDLAAHAADDSARSTERQIELEQALRHLDEGDRRLLQKYFFDDRQDLARELHVSEGALRVRIHRILRPLRERLQPERSQ